MHKAFISLEVLTSTMVVVSVALRGQVSNKGEPDYSDFNLNETFGSVWDKLKSHGFIAHWTTSFFQVFLVFHCSRVKRCSLGVLYFGLALGERRILKSHNSELVILTRLKPEAKFRLWSVVLGWNLPMIPILSEASRTLCVKVHPIGVFESNWSSFDQTSWKNRCPIVDLLRILLSELKSSNYTLNIKQLQYYFPYGIVLN